MLLPEGTLLRGGSYRIIKTLGQGGFGVTYLAEQVLAKRKVAIKEFFMKDVCNREESRMTVPSIGSQDLVDKFKAKFFKEAQSIVAMEHPGIIRIHDVFEENGTAYYVMEFLPGGSLTDKVRADGPMSEAQAVEYIGQVASALKYIHSMNTVHLDVKPSNIMLNSAGKAVLIDFGISKHYDNAGQQTSSTPVGYSRGYAPLEQMRAGDVKMFTPATDIYSLGATLYYLVTGNVPADVSELLEEGLPRPSGISDKLWKAIQAAMQPMRKDRLQTVDEFLAMLEEPKESVKPEVAKVEKKTVEKRVVDEETVVEVEERPKEEPKEEPKEGPKRASGTGKKLFMWGIVAGIAVVVAVVVGVLVWVHENRTGLKTVTIEDFKFYYPEGWTFSQKKESDNEMTLFFQDGNELNNSLVLELSKIKEEEFEKTTLEGRQALLEASLEGIYCRRINVSADYVTTSEEFEMRNHNRVEMVLSGNAYGNPFTASISSWFRDGYIFTAFACGKDDAGLRSAELISCPDKIDHNQ